MFDLFKIGFVQVTFLDVVDIAIVAIFIYKFYTFLRDTIGAQIFLGLIIVLVLSFTSQAIGLRALSWLLKFITDIWIIAFIIVFQPEIRRFLVILGKNPLLKIIGKGEYISPSNIIAEAAYELSQQQHGALIIVVKSSGIRSFSETGEIINARLSKDLLKSIFYPRSPLHDGAAIIKNDTIEAVRCTMPLSLTTIVDGISLGTRHRAGLGITEQADVISVIVSEETGSISVAENGHLKRGLSKEALRKRINDAIKGERSNFIVRIFGKEHKEN
jgi:diadenylate cyclase